MDKRKNGNPKSKKKLAIVMFSILAVLLLLLAVGWIVYSHTVSKLHYEERTTIAETGTGTPPPLVDESASEEEKKEAERIEKMLLDNIESPRKADNSDADVTNILLIGVDNNSPDSMQRQGNADGLVILSINRTTRQVVLTSLMRDIYVAVPKQFNTKLTLSYHYGGIPMLINTIEANFGVTIDNYALVNYIDVVNIVDAFGGVEVDLREDEIFAMESKIKNVNELMGLESSANAIDQSQAGVMTLNGVQTAAYLRIRMAGHGDYERTERARRVITKLVKKVRGMNFAELSEVADVVLPCITTDLTQGEIFTLLVNLPKYMKYDLVSSRIPVEGSSYSVNMNGYFLIIDYDVNREYLFNSIYNGIQLPAENPDEK